VEEDFLICKYPPDDDHGAVIFTKDYESIADPEGWLTDQAVDYWNRRQVDLLLDPAVRRTVAVLPTCFFLFLNGTYEDDQAGLSKWTKKHDLFNTRVVIMPVVHHDHWYAVTVAGLDGTPDPTIAVLDSLGWREEHDLVTDLLWKFLCREWSGGAESFPPAPTYSVPAVTRQRDGYNCGIFLLLNIEAILRDPNKYAYETIPEVHKDEDVVEKRKEIKEVIEKENLAGLQPESSLLHGRESGTAVAGDHELGLAVVAVGGETGPEAQEGDGGQRLGGQPERRGGREQEQGSAGQHVGLPEEARQQRGEEHAGQQGADGKAQAAARRAGEEEGEGEGRASGRGEGGPVEPATAGDQDPGAGSRAQAAAASKLERETLERKLEQFEVILCAKGTVQRFNLAMTSGSQIDCPLYRSWKELKAAATGRNIEDVLENHIMQGVPKKVTVGSRQPKGPGRVDLQSQEWKDLLLNREKKKSDQEEAKKGVKKRREERERKKMVKQAEKVKEAEIRKNEKEGRKKRKSVAKSTTSGSLDLVPPGFRSAWRPPPDAR
jgi:hypothetical protein